MSPTKQSYQKITKRFSDLRTSGNNVLKVAEVAYAEQFKNRTLDKDGVLARLMELYTKLGVLLKEVTDKADEMITSGVVTFATWSDLMTEISDYKATIGMSLNTLRRKPTQSIVFTDRGGVNSFRFDFA